MGLSHLKASLKDPGFIKKIRDLEDRRQVRALVIFH
jgi:DNA-binding MarR family transcriptional regulator